jgi:hypothetical protein
MPVYLCVPTLRVDLQKLDAGRNFAAVAHDTAQYNLAILYTSFAFSPFTQALGLREQSKTSHGSR